MRDNQGHAAQNRGSGLARPAAAGRADTPSGADPQAEPVPARPWLLRQASHDDPVRPPPARSGPAPWSRRRALALIVGSSAVLWALLLGGWHAL